METFVGWLLSLTGTVLKVFDLFRNRRKPMLQVTGKTYKARAGRIEIDVVLEAGDETLVKSISFDGCNVVSGPEFPFVLHKTGSVLRVTDLGYKKLQVTAKPSKVTVTVEPGADSGSILTGRVKSSLGETVFYVERG